MFFVADCDLDKFEEVESEYIRWLASHRNALGLLYYAGHAVEFKNRNWLILKSAKRNQVTKASVDLTKFISGYVQSVLRVLNL